MRDSVEIRFGIRRSEVKKGEFVRAATASKLRREKGQWRSARYSRARRATVVAVACFREEEVATITGDGELGLSSLEIASSVQSPNQ